MSAEHRASASRLGALDPDRLDAEQRRVHDAILTGPRGVVQGPLRVWLTSPGLADRAQAHGAFCPYRTPQPPPRSAHANRLTRPHRRAVELVGILGYYGLISMTINAFAVPLPDGAEDPFG